jgi:hypothetical protein
MAEYKDREHFIPLRRSDLIDMLCADKDLPDAEREPFRQLCRLVTATYHFEYNQLLDQLKAAYAPFDPDTDTKPLTKFSSDQKQAKLNDLLNEFACLMDKANYKHLTLEDIEPALTETSAWGLRMDVDFKVFERLAIFARGDTVQKRTLRSWKTRYRLEEVQVPIYQRLVMILKLRRSKRLDRHVDTNTVYIQIFKDIPKVDIKMLLPGSRVRMSLFDRGKIGIPMLGGIVVTVMNIFRDIFDDLIGVMFNHPAAWWGLASGTLGYGFKSYFGWQSTKQRYNLNLTQVLYFNNLDTNAGVLCRLLDEAEEQECREAILAYYSLWRFGGAGWTARELDDYIELDLERRLNLKVDFEIGDAIAILEKMQLIEKLGDRYRAQPLDVAIRMLNCRWNSLCKSQSREMEESPVSAARNESTSTSTSVPLSHRA